MKIKVFKNSSISMLEYEIQKYITDNNIKSVKDITIKYSSIVSVSKHNTTTTEYSCIILHPSIEKV